MEVDRRKPAALAGCGASPKKVPDTFWRLRFKGVRHAFSLSATASAARLDFHHGLLAGELERRTAYPHPLVVSLSNHSSSTLFAAAINDSWACARTPQRST